jgi:type I restriction enzyme, R subunit
MPLPLLSETDICEKIISPALVQAGWDMAEQWLRNYPIRIGRVVVRGRKAGRDASTTLFADYVLFYKTNIPIAVIEAKKASLNLAAGMQQAIDYARLLDVPFCFASNGSGFVFRDATVRSREGELEKTLGLHEFPSPQQLWEKLCAYKGWPAPVRQINEQAFSPSKTPRYYQLTAINRTVEAIANGQQRALLVMATGTGKTYTAFQIIWRLWKSGAKKRILFLADRNILIDQTMVNDFRPFKGAMAKLSPHAKGIERIAGSSQSDPNQEIDLAVNKTTKQVDKSYEVYMSLYQAVTGTDDDDDIYKQFSPQFFDLIVVDECHRGSADENSAWRSILSYFSSAAQIGLTATPKETKDISNTDYFGEPIFTYSLRQGIEDGYLAPYKVVRVDLDKDVYGWRPPEGMKDKYGHTIEDRIYNQTDMNRSLVLESRDRTVASAITQYLQSTSRMDKTIVFCEDIDHAARMRQALVNANADLCAKEPRYVVQIKGDNAQGKLELDNFIDPEKPYPVIAVTSRLMSTGVDAQTCKLIVLDQTIKSMTMFKQIIGRGTRLREDFGKTWFTILDFKRATDNFADPAFDGDPVQIYEPKAGDPIAPPDDLNTPYPAIEPAQALIASDNGALAISHGYGNAQDGDAPRRYIVGNQVSVSVARQKVQYLNAEGKLITESLRDYTRINLQKRYESLDAFLQAWSAADRKQVLVQELERHGVLLEALADEVQVAEQTLLDPFDLVLHVAYNQKPLTRRQRAQQLKSRLKLRDVFAQYGSVARKVIDALIDKYADEGLSSLESDAVLRLPPINHLGSAVELIRSFGGRAGFQSAISHIEREIYAPL